MGGDGKVKKFWWNGFYEPMLIVKVDSEIEEGVMICVPLC
jgi:hypothetical protein